MDSKSTFGSCKHPVGQMHGTRRLRHLYHIIQQSVESQSCCTSPTSHSASIEVTPCVSLFDQKVHIKVNNLPSNGKVTLHLMTEQEWRRSPALFVSCSHHIASQSGEIELDTSPSIGGSYTGVDPMGLFWSLRPAPSGPQNIRMVVKNVDQPCLYTLSVYPGHLKLNDLEESKSKINTGGVTCKPLSVTTVTRLKKAADVRKIPVREGGVRGTLFLPPGVGPHPGVIDMFGSAGGIMEMRAALLASHGFAVLSLPFFRYEDLTRNLDEVKFDYFKEAVRWFSSLENVKNGGIGIVAVSTGAMFGLLMAWQFPEVIAVVHINGPSFVWLNDVHYQGKLLKKFVPCQEDKVDETEEGVGFKKAFPHAKKDLIPVWESSAKVLCIVSEDDQQCNPEYTWELYNMYPEDKRHLIETVNYPEAGHLLEPPYTPHCRYCINPAFGVECFWGGLPASHAAAQEDAWQRVITFLRNHLP